MGRTKRQPAAGDAQADSATKGERTRALIKSAVIELLGEKGQKFVLEDVCARTGLTVGAFYFHFTNKDHVVEEIVIDHMRSYYGGAKDAFSNPDLFAEIFAVIWQGVMTHEENPAIYHLPYRVIPASVRVYNEWLRVRGAMIERFARSIANQRRGEKTIAGTDYLAAQFLMAGVEGFMENAYYGSDPLMDKIDLKPLAVSRDLSIIWYRAVLGREPDEDSVKMAIRTIAKPAAVKR